ncbi:amidohydrolase [Bradyrhizobium sp. 2TAF24]|uniref:amidohydrolase n=1 Tax=Bradyrhizobium sp. 2TAF24 TaxID=3233011 RepID=UPI003F8E2F02
MCVACNPGLAAVLEFMASRRTVLQTSAGLTASAWLPSVPARAQGAHAELLFRNGTVMTMDPAKPRAQAVAVSGGRIVAVGSDSDLDGLRNADTKVIDLAGGTLLPGLIDPHMHSAFVTFESWLDVGPFAMRNMDDVVSALRTAAAQAAPGAWVKAWQFDATITPGTTVIDLALLDRIAPDHPLFLYESNGHIAHVNTAALKAAGVTRDTPDPPQGHYGRDANGELTGRVDETPALMPFMAKIGMPSADELAAALGRLFRTAASRGCTGLFDCALGFQGLGDLKLIQSVMANNPPVRYGGTLVSSRMKAWQDAGLKPGFGNDRFRVSAIKAWADGSNQGRSGYQRQPYLNSDSRGLLNYTAEQLTQAIRIAHDDGWQVCVHANGDAAIDTTIDAYDAVLRTKPRDDHRHRLEHCSILHDEQIARMKALGLSPSFLIGHVHYWGRAFRDDILGPERANRLDPCASALRGGLRPTLHSDWSVTEIGPLRMVENAVTRIMRDGGEVLNPAERVPIDAALRMVTADAAWQCRWDFTGVLAAGKAADLVILDKDPTTVDPTTLRGVPVRETWLDGERRFQA